MRDLKYLVAYIAPLSAVFGVYVGGVWSFSAFYVAFIIIPTLEFFWVGNGKNHAPEAEESRTKGFLFDIMLYLNVPLLLGILAFVFWRVSCTAVTPFEVAGMIVSVGIACGTIGINVAHELGHRETAYERTMAQVLLLCSLYMHFIIAHNLGHHKNVSTDEDPASARLGEGVYAFIVRSVWGSYWEAWALEAVRLEREGKAVVSVYNTMIWFQVIQVSYLAAVYAVFGATALLVAVLSAIIGFVLLELINYIEHYGLRRKKLDSGRYEKVMPWHSWNSNHELGRIFLYELTRHADHHYKATRKYQILRHFDESPQLPLGYPGSILMALVPPLWFKVMDKEVAKFNKIPETN